MAVDRPDPAESFRSQLLLYRSRSRLTQREFAARAGVHFRSVQDWETGANLPTAERLRGFSDISVGSGGTNASGPRSVVFVGSYRVRPRRVMTAAMRLART